MPDYNLPALSIKEQIDQFTEKGLAFDNIQDAEYWLSYISYFRLRHYTYSFRNPDGNFNQNTNFNQILELYRFDKKLRLIIFDAIQCIEVAIKTIISNIISLKHGIYWYTDSSFFDETFDHSGYLQKIKEKFEEADEPSIRVHKKKYNSEYPPSWMMMELITFSTLSKIYFALTCRQEQQEICWHFRLPDNVFLSWLHCFSLIRNKCAHHSRLVYRSVEKEPILPSRKKHIFLRDADDVVRSSLYCALSCMQYLLDKINPSSDFKQGIKNLIEEYPNINYQKMGFLDNWQTEQIWTT